MMKAFLFEDYKSLPYNGLDKGFYSICPFLEKKDILCHNRNYLILQMLVTGMSFIQVLENFYG
jgi:hypothetical protein